MLLADASGSMSGRPFDSAVAGTIMLGQALSGIGCNVEAAGFLEDHGGCGNNSLIHDIWCKFGSRFNVPRLMERALYCQSALCNNSDGESLLYAYHRLLQQPEARKVMIVLSDGSPSAIGPIGAAGMGVTSFTHHVIKHIEADKRVRLIAIGVAGYSPSRFYRHSYVSNSADQLHQVLLQVASENVLK
jgi:cobaltochelatase CobT